MRSGTTPTLEISVDIDVNAISKIWVTFATKTGTEVLTKTKEDCEFSGGKIYVELSQEDTLALNPCKAVDCKNLLQVRILTTANKAYASAIKEINVERTLKEGIIS